MLHADRSSKRRTHPRRYQTAKAVSAFGRVDPCLNKLYRAGLASAIAAV
jgi:hypothetical protein